MTAAIEKELEEAQAKWQQTQQELDKTKSELHDIREELERSQSQLDEVLGELEQTHFELHQLKEKGESGSDGEVKQELEETKAKLQETEELLEKSQSQLGETMGLLEGYQSQMEQTMGLLEESQGKLQQKQEELELVKGELAQKQSGSDSQLQKELEETKSQLRQTEELLEQYQSQLEQTMEVLEQSQSQLQQAQLKEKQEQQQSGSESELQKELEETKAKLQETEELLEQYQSQMQQKQKELDHTTFQLQQAQNQLNQKSIELLKIKGVDSVKVTQELMKIIQQYITEERIESQRSKFAKGSIQQRQRVVKVAEYCAQNFPGDFIEIGCFQGETTKLLAEVAKRYDRKVIALDPWETGTQNCQGGEYEAFLKNIEPYQDYVDIIRASSLDEKAINLVKNRQLSCAFVDGLHTYDACLVDIQTVSHCFGIIAVDDILWSPEVENAFHKGAAVTNRKKLFLPVCREGYLLPSSI